MGTLQGVVQSMFRTEDSQCLSVRTQAHALPFDGAGLLRPLQYGALPRAKPLRSSEGQALCGQLPEHIKVDVELWEP